LSAFAAIIFHLLGRITVLLLICILLLPLFCIIEIEIEQREIFGWKNYELKDISFVLVLFTEVRICLIFYCFCPHFLCARNIVIAEVSVVS